MNSPHTAEIAGLAAREQAQSILHEVIDRARKLDEVLEYHSKFNKLHDRDRAFAHNLVATTLRRLGQIDAAIEDRLNRPLPRSASAVRNALRLGVCQLLYLQTPAHAAVDTAVELIGRSGPDKFKGLVNAILRQLVRDGPVKLAQKYPERTNVPDWLWQSWKESFGVDVATNIGAVHLQTPPLDLTTRETPDIWATTLGGLRIGKSTVRLPVRSDITVLDGFENGAWWVQDAAAALPAQILTSALPAGRICDLCAAPGGKTAQLAAAGHNVTAVDISPKRIRILDANMCRLGLRANMIEANALNWEPTEKFDAVLVDAPCSATGTIRRHPDIPHLKSVDDVIQRARLQTEILRRAISLAAPGGIIVYSVCSLEPTEGVEQIEVALNTHSGLEIEPIKSQEIPDFAECRTSRGFVQTIPTHLQSLGGVDGFFIARLRKKV
ncbi:MAG: RsmB/NOP family class I SAM-dependent RNA methyltransferase [Pseudomonadota bacterium]|nr:RsmB/NOP family class I SAM-dependent RNA methyltransferase [Pseudomonadota bacterium]